MFHTRPVFVFLTTIAGLNKTTHYTQEMLADLEKHSVEAANCSLPLTIEIQRVLTRSGSLVLGVSVELSLQTSSRVGRGKGWSVLTLAGRGLTFPVGQLRDVATFNN